MSEIISLIYVHDPMCSWCWGYRPTWQRLKKNLPPEIRVEYVLGGLAPDNDEPMPQELQNTIQGYWRRIQSELGTEFNFDFWTQCKPRRSTYPACRAVIAAKQQGRELEMIEAIQRAYYLRAMNPSDVSTLKTLAQEIGLDERKFGKDIASPETERELQQQIQFVRNSPCRGFPGLLLKLDAKLIPVQVDYLNVQTTLDAIELCVSRPH